MNSGIQLDVELHGGPLDGHRDKVELREGGGRVWLFKDAVTGTACAYAWADRAIGNGKRWVVAYVIGVGKQGGAA